MADNARKTGAALEAHFRFLLWLVPEVEKFPRTQKFLLGDRIQTTALGVLECLIEATYTRDRKGHLTRANLGIEKLRFFFQLAVELHYLDRRRYEHAALHPSMTRQIACQIEQNLVRPCPSDGRETGRTAGDRSGGQCDPRQAAKARDAG